MSTDPSSRDPMAETLPDLALRLENQVNESRRWDEPAAILTTATNAVDTIERLAAACANDEQRRALSAARRLTYNAAADCWPGWSESAPAVDEPTLTRAWEMSRRSARLVERLELGPVQQGTAAWLSGAFELALGRFADAAAAFTIARRHYIAAEAPGLALLAEGYIAIVRLVAPSPGVDAGKDFEQVCAALAAGGFEDGAAWIDQLGTALKVFTRSQA